MPKASQFDLFLPDGGPRVPSLGDCEPVPAGPYRVGMTFDYGLGHRTPPYTIVAADDRTIAGHIDNLAAAMMIADALNARQPDATA